MEVHISLNRYIQPGIADCTSTNQGQNYIRFLLFSGELSVLVKKRYAHSVIHRHSETWNPDDTYSLEMRAYWQRT